MDTLLIQAAEIRDEKGIGENTATRIGTLFTDIIKAHAAAEDTIASQATTQNDHTATLADHTTAITDLQTAVADLQADTDASTTDTPTSIFQISGIVNGVTTEIYSIGNYTGISAIVYDTAKNRFLLRTTTNILTGAVAYYISWASVLGQEDATVWNGSSTDTGRLTPGNCFYIDCGDGTMRWLYYDGTQMLEAAPTIEGNTLVF